AARASPSCNLGERRTACLSGLACRSQQSLAEPPKARLGLHFRYRLGGVFASFADLGVANDARPGPAQGLIFELGGASPWRGSSRATWNSGADVRRCRARLALKPPNANDTKRRFGHSRSRTLSC